VAVLAFGAAERDVAIQAAQVLKDVFEGSCDGLLERPVTLALSILEGAEQLAVLLAIAGPGVGSCRSKSGLPARLCANASNPAWITAG
jgi:hypothetical protein